ncbi:MAG: hypothetical protein QOF78_479 [Phycisphaerales bacterium]|jgi:hypothetical protein|nr:hypothetical protein [Phycisphaerales bacterium]
MSYREKSRIVFTAAALVAACGTANGSSVTFFAPWGLPNILPFEDDGVEPNDITQGSHVLSATIGVPVFQSAWGTQSNQSISLSMGLQGDWDLQRSGEHGWNDWESVQADGDLRYQYNSTSHSAFLSNWGQYPYASNWSDSFNASTSGTNTLTYPLRTTTWMNEWDVYNGLGYTLQTSDPGSISGAVRSMFHGAISMTYTFTPSNKWTGGGGGGGPANWNNGANWGGGVPNAVGAHAWLDDTAALYQVSLDSAVTVGTLMIDSTTAYTISGPYGLTLDHANMDPQFLAQGASHTISADVHLSKSATITVGSGADLTLSGQLSAASNATLSKNGPGALHVSNLRVPAVSVGGGTIEVVANGTSSGTSKVTDLSIVDAKLDLRDNDLVVNYSGASPLGISNGARYTGVTGNIQSASNAGAWDGPGITTSMSDAASGLTTLGIAEAADVLGLTGSDTALWGGQTVDATSLLIKYTYAGDLNLDGLISGDDYSAIDFNINVPGASGYYNGDVNYDGIISGDDYSTLDFNYTAQGQPNTTGAPGGVQGMTTVPEPGFLSVPLIGIVLMISRRRKRS